MSRRKFIAEQYQLTETGEVGNLFDMNIKFSIELINTHIINTHIIRACEKKIERRPKLFGYEIVVFTKVGYHTGEPKEVFKYKVQY